MLLACLVITKPDQIHSYCSDSGLSNKCSNKKGEERVFWEVSIWNLVLEKKGRVTYLVIVCRLGA